MNTIEQIQMHQRNTLLCFDFGCVRIDFQQMFIIFAENKRKNFIRFSTFYFQLVCFFAFLAAANAIYVTDDHHHYGHAPAPIVAKTYSSAALVSPVYSSAPIIHKSPIAYTAPVVQKTIGVAPVHSTYYASKGLYAYPDHHHNHHQHYAYEPVATKAIEYAPAHVAKTIEYAPTLNKAIDYAHVQKYDTRFTNDHHYKVAVPAVATAPIYAAAPAIVHHEPSYHHSPSAHYAHAAPIAYSSAAAVAHATFQSADAHYSW